MDQPITVAIQNCDVVVSCDANRHKHNGIVDRLVFLTVLLDSNAAHYSTQTSRMYRMIPLCKDNELNCYMF